MKNIMKVLNSQGETRVHYIEEQISEEEIHEINQSLVKKSVEKYLMFDFIGFILEHNSQLGPIAFVANKITDAYRKYNDKYIASLIFEQWVLFSQVLLPYYNSFKSIKDLKGFQSKKFIMSLTAAHVANDKSNPDFLFFKYFTEESEGFFRDSNHLLFFLRASFKDSNQIPNYCYERLDQNNSPIIGDKKKQEALIKAWQDCFYQLKKNTIQQITNLSFRRSNQKFFNRTSHSEVLSDLPFYFWDKSLQITQVFLQLIEGDGYALSFFKSKILSLNEESAQTESLEDVFHLFLNLSALVDPSTEPFLSAKALDEASSQALSIILNEDIVDYYNRRNPDKYSYVKFFAAFEEDFLDNKKDK